MITLQTEFPLTVAVCAWCKPQSRGESGTQSHGICLKHLRKLKLQARGIVLKRAQAGPVASEPESLSLFGV